MRTENYLKHGVISVLLVFALVFSMVTISAPLTSAGTVIYNPGGSTLVGEQGGTVTVTHTLEFSDGTDNVTNDGAYTITMSWLNYDNLASENLTFVSASAIFTTGPHTGQSQIADVIAFSESPAGDDTRWTLAIGRSTGNKDNRNGQFDVDIVLGLYGDGGVPHTAAGAVGDNHPIEYHFAGIAIVEASPASFARDPITIDVIGIGVTVDVTPAWQEDWSGNDLIYTVTVTNTGESADNFALVATDNSGWTLDVSPTPLEIADNDSDTATLTVTVGSGLDNVTVTATGTWASDSDSVEAEQKEGPNVDVEVSPDYQEDLPGTELYYDVVTTNTGTVTDNITVSVEGDATSPDWDEHFSTVQIYPTDDSHVAENFPDQVEGNGTSYNMYVGWESDPYGGEGWKTRAYLKFDLSSITAGSTINSATFNAKVQYGPSTGYPSYTADNMLTDVKAVSGDSWLENELTWSTAPAVGSTLDTVNVLTDPPQYVWYSWDVGSFIATEYAGDGVASLCMLSENKEADNTDCTVWFYTKDASGTSDDPYLEVSYTPPGGFIVELAPGASDNRVLTVEIHENAPICTIDNVTVTATSGVNPAVSDSETVQAHAKAAKIVNVLPIDPQWQEQHANKSLNYFVTIVNEGEEPDNYDVVLDDTLGWDPTWDITLQLLPTDDGAATEGFPDLVEDGGVDYNTYNGWTPTYLSQRPYFKFDISAVPHGSWIKSATFWATGRYGPSWPGYDDTWHLVDAMSVDDDDWDETTLTWTNAPPVVDVLDTDNFAGDLFVDQWTWLSWDVTDFVADEMLVNQLATIALKAQVENADIYPSGGSAGWFRTKDTATAPYWPVADYGPYLEILYMPGVSDTVTISLDENTGVTLGFGVTIPADVIPFTTDTITVTATSQTDGSVTDSESTEAYAGSMRGVEAVVEGPVWQETHKDPLTYVIRIHNTGQIADMYKLTAYDKRDWPLHIEPQEIYLKPSHSAQAALSVTIPYQELGSTVDNIWVVIQGKLASGTFSDPENSIVRVDVQAHSKEVKGVDLNVYPSIHQTGHPDSPLTWLVTVTNTGNVPDTYDLDFSQYVYDLVDVYPEWLGGLSEITIALDAYEEASILLTLTVPDTEDMRTGVHNDIDITVISQTDPEINDTQQVTAQVRQQMPHVPQGEIKLQAVAGYVAIDIWPTYYDFGVLNEMEQRATPPDYFTIRNVGNVYVDVTIVGMDATSKPGEPAAKWTLGDWAIGVDMYALWWTSGGEIVDSVTKEEKILTDELAPSDETQFDLMIRAPSTFTTPAKMWMKVAITARKLHPQP